MVAVRLLVPVLAVCVLLAGCGSGDEAERPIGSAAPQQESLTLAVARVVTGNPPRRDVILLDANGRVLRTLVGGGLSLGGRVAWSPDGARIAVAATARRRPSGSEATDIVVADTDGSNRRRVTAGGRAFAPLWTPDGRTLVYAERAPGPLFPPRTVLVALDVETGESRRLLDSGPMTADLPSSFSPDGSTLLFTRSRWSQGGGLNATTSVYELDLETLEPAELLTRGADAVFSPDGERIAYVTDSDEYGRLSYGDRTFHANELYVAAADGAAPRRLTRTRDRNERAPAWSPDGELIAYQRGEQTGNAEAAAVLTIHPDGSCPRLLAHDPGLAIWYHGPSWRPGLPRDRSHLRCEADAPAAAAPLSGNLSLEQARRFRDFGLWWVGRRFEGYQLSSIASQPALGSRFVDLHYGGFELQLWPVEARTPAKVDLPPDGKTCIRGVEAVFFEGGHRLELVTGRTTIVIFGRHAQIVRVARALRPLASAGAGDRSRPLPPPAVGVRAASRCG